MQSNENMKQVPNHPKYFVSSDGRVFSKRKESMRELKQIHAGGRRGVKGRYCYVNLGRSFRIGVHQLVALCFLPPPEMVDGKVQTLIRHMDGNPENNDVSNLRWGTQKQNLNDRYLHGTMTHGTKNGQSKITDADVAKIRERRINGEPCHLIAQDFGICKQQVNRIALGQRWKQSEALTAPRVRAVRGGAA